MTPSLLDKWNFYLKDVESPQNFIDAGWYFMISSALQRRVWLGGDERPIFPNQYIIFVSPPAIGKGVVTTPVSQFLRHWKLRKGRIYRPPPAEIAKVEEPKKAIVGTDGVEEVVYGSSLVKPQTTDAPADAYQNFSKPGDRVKREPLAFPMAPDSSNFADLLYIHARAIRYLNVKNTGIIERLSKKGLYMHCSLNLVLDEISSYFSKDLEGVIRYFLTVYDCKDYEKSTKTLGEDFVMSSCLNILGGTQPDTMAEFFANQIIKSGFTSRALFIYGSKKRFEKFDPGRHSPEQEAAKQEILDHLFNLAEIFGPMTYSAEAYEFCTDYFERVQPALAEKFSSKLEHYFGRRKLHIQKLAIAIHFSHPHNLNVRIIQKHTVEQAIAVIEHFEKDMNLALQIKGENPEDALAKKIQRYLEKAGGRGATFIELWAEFLPDADRELLEKTIEFLASQGKIKGEKVKDKLTYKRADRL